MLTLDPDTISHPFLHEQSLWEKVLRLAILDLRRGTELRKRAARAWIESDETETGSFVWTAEVLGLSADAARQAILNRYNSVGTLREQNSTKTASFLHNDHNQQQSTLEVKE